MSNEIQFNTGFGTTGNITGGDNAFLAFQKALAKAGNNEMQGLRVQEGYDNRNLNNASRSPYFGSQSNSGANAQQAFNNVMALRNTYNAEQQANNAGTQATEDNDRRIENLEKTIAEDEKWLDEHKADYELAKKWIARFNDPIFQGLNSKGIDSGDFTGASNYVLQQDQREAEAKKDGSGTKRGVYDTPMDAFKAYKMAVANIEEKGRDGQSVGDVSALSLEVKETIFDLEEAGYQDYADDLKEKLGISKGNANLNQADKDRLELSNVYIELEELEQNHTPEPPATLSEHEYTRTKARKGTDEANAKKKATESAHAKWEKAEKVYQEKKNKLTEEKRQILKRLQTNPANGGNQ